MEELEQKNATINATQTVINVYMSYARLKYPLIPYE